MLKKIDIIYAAYFLFPISFTSQPPPPFLLQSHAVSTPHKLGTTVVVGVLDFMP